MSKKFYVVWVGRETGVFSNWTYTQKLVNQFPQAKFKSFSTEAEANAAYAAGYGSTIRKLSSNTSSKCEVENKNNFFPPKSSQIKKDVTSNKIFDITIYCDGACDPNPGQSASGVAVYSNGSLLELWYGLYNPQGTNNTAELNALFQSLLIANDNISSGKSVQILCDSQYSINCITVWAFSWKEKGWKRKVFGDIKNLEIIKQAHALYVSIKSEVDVSHVKAHSGIEGNELADRMSVFGIDQKDYDFCRYSGALNIYEILGFRAG